MMKVVFSEQEGSFQLNCIYLQTGLIVILEDQEYRAFELFVPLVFAYVDTWMVSWKRHI